ncbi:unnamed protein product [Penicillium roqueforti FM164]|uniref:Genomic scaffold, ProqFM164S01 n=1 Tax=Penicillium roqueforti (strain FM164) TaxID=1365484 RepID=W6PRM9_PENRF|nr:unnamed protein product [Penicillium roqueforti FM164]
MTNPLLNLYRQPLLRPKQQGPRQGPRNRNPKGTAAEVVCGEVRGCNNAINKPGGSWEQARLTIEETTAWDCD